MAKPVYLVRCWYCRQWHDEHEHCPMTFIKLLASLFGQVVVGVFDLAVRCFEVSLRVAAVGLVVLFAYLCFTII